MKFLEEVRCMALIPYDPFRMLEPIWGEMDRFFQRRDRTALSEWLYRVDVDETSDKVIVTAEIPGVGKKEDLDISIDADLLTIRGEIKRGTQEEGRFSRLTERYYGQFSRTINLPAPVKADGTHASYKNGILELIFLKDQHPAARRIEVDFH